MSIKLFQRWVHCDQTLRTLIECRTFGAAARSSPSLVSAAAGGPKVAIANFFLHVRPFYAPARQQTFSPPHFVGAAGCWPAPTVITLQSGWKQEKKNHQNNAKESKKEQTNKRKKKQNGIIKHKNFPPVVMQILFCFHRRQQQKKNREKTKTETANSLAWQRCMLSILKYSY